MFGPINFHTQQSLVYVCFSFERLCTEGKYCQTGWVAYGSYCYMVKASATDAMTHTNAQAACKAMTLNGVSANLVSIHSPAELGFVMAQFQNQNVSGRVYLGLSDVKVCICGFLVL